MNNKNLKAIRLSHGTVFVTDGVLTVRLLADGKCGISPITYQQLERDMCYESPENWEYLDGTDIRSLPDGAARKILGTFDELKNKYGFLYKDRN